MTNEPYISPDFTMTDIRILRDYNSSRHIKMTNAEIIADIDKGANEMIKRLAERKTQTIAINIA